MKNSPSTPSSPGRRIGTPHCQSDIRLVRPAVVSAVLAALLGTLLTGCAATSAIQGGRVPAGSLRLAQVTRVATQKEILEDTKARDFLVSSGIKETEIKDGCLGIGRVYCCGGPEQDPLLFYIPAGIEVEFGDIVEIRIGYPPKNGELGMLNTVTQIRQEASATNGSIRWEPPDERLWMRTLYGDWMPQEGWIYQGGLWRTWYKPPSQR